MNKQDFIDKYLHLVFKDFKNAIELGGQFDISKDICKLKTLDYKSEDIPDYKDEIIQQLYILRYGYAYFWEYIKLYESALYKIMACKDAPLEVNVLSIGSGPGIDQYALSCELEDLKMKDRVKGKYVAFDKVRWNYSYDKDWNINTKVVHNIYELRGINMKYNICIFPKSIGELDERTYREIIYYICDNCADKLILINSIRKDHTGFDKERFDNLTFVLGAVKRFKYDKNELGIQTFTAGDREINGMYGEKYEYPQDIKDYLSDLLGHCKEYKLGECPDKAECLNLLGRYPMTKAGNLSYEIVELKKQ